MTLDADPQRRVSRLLATTARAHHEATGGPNANWAQWYAARMHPEVGDALGVTPDVATLADWLTAADERYQRETPDVSWPTAYAGWFLEWAEDLES